MPDHGEGAVRGPGKACAAACLAFSPDGSLLASGPAWDGTGSFLGNWAFITLWDVAAKRELRRFVGHPVQIRSLAFSPDGKSLASSGGEPQARTWNVATGNEIDPRPGHPHGIVALAVSMPDGTVFTSGNDDGLVIHWDPASGRPLETLALPPERFSHLAVSPDGRTLAISEDSDARNPNLVLWDIAGHKELRRFKVAGGCEPVFSPDGLKLAMGLSVYDVASGKRVDGFSRNTALEAWFTADSRRLISGSRDGVDLSDFKAGIMVRRPVEATLNTWFNAAVSPDGRLVATGNITKNQPLACQMKTNPTRQSVFGSSPPAKRSRSWRVTPVSRTIWSFLPTGSCSPRSAARLEESRTQRYGSGTYPRAASFAVFHTILTGRISSPTVQTAARS